MSRVLRVDANDPRIPNTGGWYATLNDHTMTCTAQGCEFFWLFRGSGIKMYGRTALFTMGTLHLELDGYAVEILLNDTTFSNGVVPIYGDENMGDGDHQLVGVMRSLTNGGFLMDHFEIENASGDGFDLLSAGPTAQNVPAQAVIVDNTDPAIIYHIESHWVKYSEPIDDYGGSSSFTSTPGASLSFSFDGVAIWFYGRVCELCGSFNVSIDDSTPHRVNAASSASTPHDLVQRMIWSNASLDAGRHTLNITYDGPLTEGVYVDFFRVLLGAGTSTLPSTTNLGELPTTVPPVPSTNQNQTNRVPLVVGLTLGLLVLVVVVLCGVRHIYLRRGRRPIDAHSVSPYTGPPIRRSDRQSSILPVPKGVPQSARPPGAAMATVDSSMSSSEIGLGPPPGYETPSYDWRVDTA